MFRYSVFAGVLASELEFPELGAATDQGDGWTVRVSSDRPPNASEIEIGTDEVEPDIPVALLARGNSFVLRYADNGDYLIDPATRTITWHRIPGALDVKARLDILGRVFAAALQGAGYYVLHGAAVALGECGLAFIAPKGAGKSTLVAQLVAAGAQFISDDSVPIILGNRMVVLPCGRSIRLLGDSLEHVRRQEPELRMGEQTDEREKPSLVIPEAAVRSTAAPLDAVYVLSRTATGEAQPALNRRRLSGPQAAVEMVRHSKLGPLLGGDMGSQAMERALTIASAVPVFALSVPRDYAQSSDVVATIMEWHAALSPQPASS